MGTGASASKKQQKQIAALEESKPKEAIDMYIQQLDWASAMRVAENSSHTQIDQDTVKEAMLHHADYLVGQGKLAAAETLFIQVGKPELAVQVYLSKHMVDDADRVCKQHCPQMRDDLFNSSGDGGQGGGGLAQSLEEILDAAKIDEEAGNYSSAIDTYLSVTETACSDLDRLEEVWKNATFLAMRHERERHDDIVAIIAKRLKILGRFVAAAEYYENIEAVREAVNCYCDGEAWEKARCLAEGRCPDMLRIIEERYKRDLITKGDGEQLMRMGDVSSALEQFARLGQWGKCLQLAAEKSPVMLKHYVIQYCKILVNKGEFAEACQALIRYGPPIEQSNWETYKHICGALLSSSDSTSPSLLRDMLLRLIKQGVVAIPPTPKTIMESREPADVEFHKALFAAHLQMVHGRFQEQMKNSEICSRISVALCRYCAEFPVDRAFYEAGLACKHANMINMSFFFLSRFLDISDAVKDPDKVAIDNSDFLHTGIPSPCDLDLPKEPHISGPQAEEIRDWVRGWNQDQSVQQKIDVRPCDKCQTDICVTSLSCPQCGAKYEPCIVTFYPVLKESRVECTNCKAAANRGDWNTWLQLFKTCAWCGSPQSAQY